MARVRVAFGWRNDIDGAVVSQSANLPSHAATNLADPELKRRWRAGTATASIIADFGAQRAIGATMLAGTNFTANLLRRVRLATADSTGATGDAYDSGEDPAGAEIDPSTGLWVHLLGEPVEGDVFEPSVFEPNVFQSVSHVQGRFLRIDLSDSVANLEAGRWFAGEIVSPQRNIEFGYRRGVVDPSQKRFTPGRSPQGLLRTKHRTLTMDFRFLTEDEAHGFADRILSEVGILGDLLVVFRPDSQRLARDSIWGQLQRPRDWSQPDFGRFSWTIDIMERK